MACAEIYQYPGRQRRTVCAAGTRRGADGIMTGFAYPDMLVSVFSAVFNRPQQEAEDLFDMYLPLVRHEQQPGSGLRCARKFCAARRHSIAGSPSARSQARRLRPRRA